MNIPIHPCVCQKGSCKFGEKCRFYHIRGDACLFHLRQQMNGGEGCRYGNNCKNPHVSLFDNVNNVNNDNVGNVDNDIYRWKEREEERLLSNMLGINEEFRKAMKDCWEKRQKEQVIIMMQPEYLRLKSIKYETIAASIREERAKNSGESNGSNISKEKKRSEKIIKSLQNKERLKELSKKPDKLIVFTVSGPKEINPYDEDTNITKRYQREISEHQKIQGEKERLQRKVDPVKRQQHKEYKANMDRDTHQEYNGYIPGGKRGCTNCNGGCSCCVDSHPSQNYEYSRFAQ